jgi:flagellar biosynthetic protein FliR
MDLFNFDPVVIFSFWLTLMRISIVLFVLPFYGGKSVPKPVKLALLLVLTLAVWPRLSFDAALMPANPYTFAVMMIGEIMLGLIMALLVNVIFAAIQTGGNLIGYQMGFAMVNIVDPLTGVSETVTAHFMYMVALFVFLALNGHLYLLHALAQSFELVPPGTMLINPELADRLLELGGQIFVLAIKVAAPVTVSILLIDLTMALISKAAPQLHVLIIGFPVKITVGFIFLSILFSTMALFMENFVTDMPEMFVGLLRVGTQ